MTEAPGDATRPANRNRPRRPRQKRGMERYEAILDAAHALLADRPMSDVSLYDVAREVGCAPATVYHLFPSTNALFFALAERYAEAWVAMLGAEVDDAAAHRWHDIVRPKFTEAMAFYNDNPQAMEVYLGLGTTREIRARQRIGGILDTDAAALFKVKDQHFGHRKFLI